MADQAADQEGMPEDWKDAVIESQKRKNASRGSLNLPEQTPAKISFGQVEWPGTWMSPQPVPNIVTLPAHSDPYKAALDKILARLEKDIKPAARQAETQVEAAASFLETILPSQLTIDRDHSKQLGQAAGLTKVVVVVKDGCTVPLADKRDEIIMELVNAGRLLVKERCELSIEKYKQAVANAIGSLFRDKPSE